MAPATSDWALNQIRARVMEKGLTLKGISVDAGLHPDACSKALRIRWRDAERAIANALDVPPEEIWPSRYSTSREDRVCGSTNGRRAPTAHIVERGAEPSGSHRSHPFIGRSCTNAGTRTAPSCSSPVSPQSARSARRKSRRKGS